MDEEETLEKALILMDGVVNNKEDIDLFIQDNISKKLPLDGPLWRIWVQNYVNEGKKCTIMIWKNHHSLCDGVSIMSFNLAVSADYSRDYFVKSKDLSFVSRVMLKLSVPFMLPILLINLL